MDKYKIIKFISELLLSFGFIFILSPIFLHWFIHGNYERYIWIISGPFPFSHLGGGPFQLFIYIDLILIGTSLLVISLTIKKFIKNKI